MLHLSRLNGELYAASIKGLKPVCHTGITQCVVMSSKGVGNDYFGVVANVVLVNLAQNVRMAQCTATLPGVF
jgi:hypothetical protein